MKIAFICPHFFPHIGGVEKVIMKLASNMASMGHNVTVLTQTNNKTLHRKEVMNGFNVLRFQSVKISGDLTFSIDLLSFIREHGREYDVVHAHNYHAFPALVAALTRKTTFIFSPHYHRSGHTLLTFLLHYPYRLIGDYILSKAHAIICDTETEASLLKGDFPKYKNKTIVIPLGVDVELIKNANRYRKKSKFILAIGRLENYKNVELIIKSMQGFNKKINLKIVGNGSMMQDLEDLSDKLNLSKHVSFLGNVSDNELYRLLKTAKAYINLSSKEAYSLSFVEAVAARIGTVVSNIPVHRELIKRFDIQNTLLVDKNSSPKLIVYSLETAMNSPSQAKRELPSWDTVARQTVQIYEKLLN